MSVLDQRHYAIAAYIVSYAAQHGGNSPTVEEISNHIGRCKSYTQYLLMTMYEKGLCERKDGKLVLKGVTVTPPDWLLVQVFR